MRILDGRALAEKILSELAQEAFQFFSSYGRRPKLVIVLVGNDLASLTYVSAKQKSCEKIGVDCELQHYTSISEDKLKEKINVLNHRLDVDGIIIQLPLPNISSTQEILDAVLPEKDVDGFNSQNYGKMARMSQDFYHISATPQGILMLLDHYSIDLSGKNCVIVGRGLTVGAPLSILLSSSRKGCNATVTVCHSFTKNVEKYTREADLLIAAIGKANYFSADMVKVGAIVIDVGISRTPDSTKKVGYSLCGDVFFQEVKQKCSYVTPVPGGVGPMTIASLLKNVLAAAKQRLKL